MSRIWLNRDLMNIPARAKLTVAQRKTKAENEARQELNLVPNGKLWRIAKTGGFTWKNSRKPGVFHLVVRVEKRSEDGGPGVPPPPGIPKPPPPSM